MNTTHWRDVGGRFERAMGDSERAFVPASQAALGDMFLHLDFAAPADLLRPERVCIAWSIIRRRHPLLRSKVVLNGDDVPNLVFTPLRTVQDSLDDAESALHFTHSTRSELIFDCMNGTRKLSNERLSYLVLSTPSNPDRDNDVVEIDLIMCAPHFIGDGTSLHQSTHDFLCLIASPKSDADLSTELLSEVDWAAALPPSFEARLPKPRTALGRAAAKVNFLQTLQREIGGHAFKRVQRGPQRTIVVEHAFSTTQTTAILARCKKHGVTVNHALVALCNLAWARCISDPQSTHLPMMTYTALNLRPHLLPHTSTTYWYIPLSYMTLVLPSFATSSPATFWYRARLTKSQMSRAASSSFLPARALIGAAIRASRALNEPSPIPSPSALFPSPSSQSSLQPAPSTALLGLSLIGNLDRTYASPSTSYPSIKLHSVTTASRQKASGMLLLAHTFGGRLWLQLFYDEMGFEEGQVEGFWDVFKGAVGEYLY